MKPLFSVIIPTYNREEFICGCIESVLSQTFAGFELIVIDDGSTDATQELISGYDRGEIQYVKTDHNGVSAARNAGIDISRGSYLCFLDSDDRWDETKLEKTADCIFEFPDIFVFHTDEIWYKNGKLMNQKKKHARPSGYVFPRCLPLCCIGMSTSVVNKELFNDIGLFDTALPACEDYDFWLRVCCEYDVKLIPEPLTVKNGGREDQLSNQPGLDKYRVYSIEKLLNSGRLSDRQYQLAAAELVRKCEIYANGAIKRGKDTEAKKYLELIDNYKC